MNARIFKIVFFSSLVLCLALDYTANFETFGIPHLFRHRMDLARTASSLPRPSLIDDFAVPVVRHEWDEGQGTLQAFIILHDLAYVAFYASAVGLILKIGNRRVPA